MRKYRHKKLWWIVKSNLYWNWYDSTQPDTLITTIPKELIENSDDWKLQEEKGWIEEIIKDCINCVINDDLDADILRRSIKKHMPKITKEDIINISSWSKHQSDWSRTLTVNEVKQLLKDKWLYKE